MSFAARLPFFFGWVIIAVAFLTVAVSVTARTAFSLMFPPIVDEFGWDRGLAAGAFSFGFLTLLFALANSYEALLGPKDAQYKEWIKDFNQYDLYTKCTKTFDIDEIKAYYMPLIEKYLGKEPVYF